MQSLRAVFASNLAALCARKGGSIAQICREIGIQRAQMDRYLGGQNLPNDATTERLCSYFGIDGLALFQVQETRKNGEDAKLEAELLRRYYSPLVTGENTPRIAEGPYLATQTIASLPQTEFQSIVNFKRRDGAMKFRIKAPTASTQDEPAGTASFDFRGLAIERFGWFHLLGFNWRDGREPSLWSLRWQPVGQNPQLVGIGTIMTADGPRVAETVVRRIGSLPALRAAMRQLRGAALAEA